MVLQIENDLIAAIVGFPDPWLSNNAACRPSFSTACFASRPGPGELLAVERLRSRESEETQDLVVSNLYD
jgi:hypothetical protein